MEGSPKTVVVALLAACLLAAAKGDPTRPPATIPGCDKDWDRFGDHCYIEVPSRSFTLISGKVECETRGGALVSITNITVLDYLAQHVASLGIGKFWVGLSRQSDGSFMWFDGTGVENQPWVQTDRYDAIRPWTEDVAQGCFAYDGATVRFNPCSERIGVICSYNPERLKHKESTPGKSPMRSHSMSGRCCFSLPYRTTKVKAEELCNKEGTFIADVYGFLRGVDFDLIVPGNKYWTNLTYNGTSVLYNGQPIPSFTINRAGSGSCVTVQFDFVGITPKWTHYQTECDDEHAIADVVCIRPQGGFTTTITALPTTQSTTTTAPPTTQSTTTTAPSTTQSTTTTAPSTTQSTTTTAPPATQSTTTFALPTIQSITPDFHDVLHMDDPSYLSCPEGYNWKADRNNQYCYWETSFETEQLSWNDAESYCKAFGGHLSSFHSVEEEKIGLSFQYGSLSHPYWIGLTLDLETETYKWSDGSPLDYSNWAPGHPNHKDMQLRCVAMEAQAKHWVSSLCGILSWFICKVPAKSYHPSPILPTPTPLEFCDSSPVGPTRVRTESGSALAYFQGACYFVIVDAVNWHRAKQHCENKGASLTSIHSPEELGFLLRLLHDSVAESNRVWIGFNSFGSDGNFQWTDWTGVDFTFFSDGEPDNYQNQEKCCNMNIKNGEWADENCNAALGFICKRRNDTSGTTTVPSTQDPRIGNCKKGWIAHDDRCYYLGGRREKDRVNWTEALDICQKHGGYLTSIRDETDQNFLSYLLQTLGDDAWIGLHDTIQSGRYYWLDNSEVRYTNWAPGEPSFFGVMEDCVKLVYNHLESGVWKDEECSRVLGYICQTSKDPSLPPAPYERGLNCPHPEGWLKLDNMCFKMFVGDPLKWVGAEDACRKEGGHLVSISDQSVKAVVAYLASIANQAFFIGMRYQEDAQRVGWLNERAVAVTNWEKNEPSFLTEDTCFASTPEGYWKKTSCEEEMPYVCQITTGKPKKLDKYTGSCPPSSMQWVSGSGSYCYILEGQDRYDWFTANLMCFRYGSHLASIHSMSEIEDIKKMMKPGVRSVYIGLMRNKKGGFTWMDDSPVDFVNWDVNEPSNSVDQCAEMVADTMKWKLSTCLGKKHFVCKDRKSTLVREDPQSAGYADEKVGLSTAAICAVVASILVGVVLIVAAALYRRRYNRGAPQFRRQTRDQSVSFENALYSVGRTSMEFQDDLSNRDAL